MNDRLTHIDLFAGIGGFSLASRWAGFRTIAFCEKDEWCQQVLKKDFGAEVVCGRDRSRKWTQNEPCSPQGTAPKRIANPCSAQHKIMADSTRRENHRRKSRIMGSTTESGECINPAANAGREDGRIPLYPDIKTFPGHLYRGATLLTGGFPCQPFSCAGKQQGKADDRDLWPFMFRVIKDARPTWIIGENVAGFVKMELDRSISDLESEGYAVRTFIIPACATDAKHRRSRVWIVAHSRHGGRRAGEICGHGENQKAMGQETSNYIKQSSQDVADGQEQRLERPDATGATCAEGRIAECCQWPIEPDFRRMVDAISKRLDKINLTPETARDTLVLDKQNQGGLYGKTEITRPGEVLPALQKKIGSEEISDNLGRPDRFQKKEILQSALHGQGNDSRESDAGRIANKSGEVSRKDLPEMRGDDESRHSSQRPESSKQFSEEHTNPLFSLPYGVALGTWETTAKDQELFMQDLWQACAEIGYVPTSLSEIPKIWESLNDEEMDWIALRISTGSRSCAEWPGVPRIEVKIKDRVNKLKGLGNAIVPQVAYEIINALARVEREGERNG